MKLINQIAFCIMLLNCKMFLVKLGQRRVLLDIHVWSTKLHMQSYCLTLKCTFGKKYNIYIYNITKQLFLYYIQSTATWRSDLG